MSILTAHDIYAETNPALCAVLLGAFCDAYSSDKNISPALALTYLVLPLALSDDLADTFEGNNINTGLNVWIERNPRVLDGLSERINGTLDITTSAVRFGCITKILELNKNGFLSSNNFTIPSKIIKGPNSGVFKRIRLLGIWFRNSGSERTVFEAMGVSV